MGVIVLVIVIAIVLGTLYPFTFACPVDARSAWAEFNPVWPPSTHRGDLVANLVLFVPFGLAMSAWLGRRSAVARLVLVGTCAGVLSLMVEVGQTCLASRSASWGDVALNGASAIAGAIGAMMAKPMLNRRSLAGPADVPAALLLGLFVSWRLLPLVPTIDWQKWKDALKPLLAGPAPTTWEVLRFAIVWLAVCRLIRAVVPSRAPLAIAAFIVGYFAMKLVVVDQTIGSADLAGAGAGALAATMLARPRRIPSMVSSCLFLAMLVYVGLKPFQFDGVPSEFGWIPFAGFARGSIFTNVLSAAEKLFLYGGAVWLFVRAGLRPSAAALLVLVPVGLLEVAQIVIPGRVAEITDPLLVVFVVLVLKVLDRRAGRSRLPVPRFAAYPAHGSEPGRDR